MVTTRHHPDEFPPLNTAPDSNASKAIAKSPPPPTSSTVNRQWMHAPSTLVTIWLLVSLPLVIWDTGYVLLRPHSMPGGKWHSPVWTPYALYGTIDYMYGWPAFNAKNGFTAAQGVMNVVETAGYLFYLYVVINHSAFVTTTGHLTPKREKGGLTWFLTHDKVIPGRIGAIALLVVFSASISTLSKTVLYWLNEVFSEFDNIGHNSVGALIIYWMIPNGLWIVFPSYMIYVFGSEIVTALETPILRTRAGRERSQ